MPRSTSKRKSGEISRDDETVEMKNDQPKLTKKEQRELIKKNAQEWAQRDKAKMEAKKNKRQDVGYDVRHELEPKRKKKKLETHAKTNNDGGGGEMPLKAETREKTRAKAKAYMSRSQSQSDTSIKCPPHSNPTQEGTATRKVTADKAISSRPNDYSNSTFEGNTSDQQLQSSKQHVTLPDESQNRLEKKKKLARLSKLLQSKNQPSPAAVSQATSQQSTKLAGPQPILKKSVSMVHPPKASRTIARIPTAVNRTGVYRSDDDSDDDDDYDNISRPGLETQISQRVMENAKNFNEDNASDDDDVFIDDDDPEEADSAVRNNKMELLGWLMFCLTFAAACALFVIMTLQEPSTEDAMNVYKTSVQDRKCFINLGKDSEDVCSGNKGKPSPCPQGGFCESGEFVSCSKSFQDMSDGKDECVLKEIYLPLKTIVTNELVKLASNKCEKTIHPVDFDSLTIHHPEDSIKHSPEFLEALEFEGYRIDQEEDRLYVGLPKDFKFNLPLYCQVGESVQFLLSVVLSIISVVLMNVCKFLQGLFLNYPKVCCPAIFVVFFVVYYLLHQRKKEKQRKDIETMRDMLFNYLKENSAISHVPIHIRDELTMRMHPHSRKARLALNKEVWVHVANIAKNDTRVLVSKKLKDNKPTDTWKWDGNF